MSDEFQDFGDELEPLEGEIYEGEPLEPPWWGKALAWGTVALGVVYLVNPGAGVLELIPDVIPVVGNLDEAAIMFLVFGAMRYLGWTLPEFIERWSQPRAQLSAITQTRRLPRQPSTPGDDVIDPAE